MKKLATAFAIILATTGAAKANGFDGIASQAALDMSAADQIYNSCPNCGSSFLAYNEVQLGYYTMVAAQYASTAFNEIGSDAYAGDKLTAYNNLSTAGYYRSLLAETQPTDNTEITIFNDEWHNYQVLNDTMNAYLP